MAERARALAGGHYLAADTDLLLAQIYRCSPLEVRNSWPPDLLARALALHEAEAADRRRRERRRLLDRRRQ